MTLPLDVQCLKIALQFVKTRAKGDWEAARKLMQLDSFDTKGKGCINFCPSGLKSLVYLLYQMAKLFG